MSLFDKIKSNIRAELKREAPVSVNDKSISMGLIDGNIPIIPRTIEKKNLPYVLYGETNLYPQQINELVSTSPIHGAIVKTASDMISGDGYLLNGAKSMEETVTL